MDKNHVPLVPPTKGGGGETTKGMPHQHDAEDLEELDASWHELDVEIPEKRGKVLPPEHVENDLWS